MSDSPDDFKMPLMEHLIELRKRLMISMAAFVVVFLVCYQFKFQIYGFLVQPLAHILEERGGDRRMIFTALTEAFLTYVKVSAFAAAAICFPIWAGQIWAFVAPGLYKHERHAFLPFLLATPVLFIAGASTVYYFLMPVAWKFFLSFESTGSETNPLPIQLEARVSDYLSLVIKLILAFGVAYQMPVLFSLLCRVGLITSASLASKRRYAIVAIFVVAAVLTPPDIISQCSLAIPMLILFEISVLSCKWIERQQAKNLAEGVGEETPAPATEPESSPVPVTEPPMSEPAITEPPTTPPST